MDGKLSTFLQPAGRANGMYFDAQGNLIACADEHNELWSIAPDKTSPAHDRLPGQDIDGPNDVWVAPNGGMFITDPFYSRDYWDGHQPRPYSTRNVFYLLPTVRPSSP